MKLEDYFSGFCEANGIVMNSAGAVIRTFVVRIESSWSENVGTLNEDFTWSDGEKTRRVWTVKKTGESSYEGTENDIIGTAQGKAIGTGFFWRYRMLVKTGTAAYKIRFDDRMYKVSEKVVLNEATMYWFGLRVGKILISFQRS